ncbi:MAG: hypothetical protein IKX33_10765 [Prevotella sp.]|nr:hypothetical protein [Prevotella sp.]
MKPIVITLFVAFIATLLSPQSSMAQTDSTYVGTDSTYVDVDSTSVIIFEPAADSDDYWHADVIDSPEAEQKGKRDWTTWRPNPKRALWLAVVLPGAGQIYNRKYWKLPIIYGGFVGSIYALQWNNQMYHDYSQAYLDLSDQDPNTQSYNQFLHLGNKIDGSNESRYKTLFKKRKDYFRRYRDLSFFVLLGVYAISIIDAYVDASLSEFDISKDLSMKVSPAVINDQLGKNPIRSNALGLQCSISF